MNDDEDDNKCVGVRTTITTYGGVTAHSRKYTQMKKKKQFRILRLYNMTLNLLVNTAASGVGARCQLRAFSCQIAPAFILEIKTYIPVIKSHISFASFAIMVKIPAIDGRIHKRCDVLQIQILFKSLRRINILLRLSCLYSGDSEGKLRRLLSAH
uniref:Uncharacterized protein n=1 Tax=Glossina palpalis gambiensis TaxID=67801 RepID=A0A1B0ATT7_9MUSC